MSTTKTAPSIPAKSGLVQHNCTSRKGKDNEIQPKSQDLSQEKRIYHQRQKICKYLSQPSVKGATRMMIARAVGIERANVCRRVAELRKEGLIYSCGRHLCEITKTRAEYLTCNQHTAFEYNLSATSSIWAVLPTEEERKEMQDAIWQYVIERKDEITIFGLNASAVREKWDAVKAAIDKEAGL